MELSSFEENPLVMTSDGQGGHVGVWARAEGTVRFGG